MHTARAPAQAQGPKFDQTAVAMLALCRYSLGLLHNRMAKLQRNMKLPVLASTQWDGFETTPRRLSRSSPNSPIVLFYTGRKYAGDNLAALLEARDTDLEPPTLVSDGLDSRNTPSVRGRAHPTR